MKLFWAIFFTLAFVSGCEDSASQENNCSDLLLSSNQVSDDLHFKSSFKYGSTDFKGVVVIDKKVGTVTISAPQSFHKSPTAIEEIKVFKNGVQCLIGEIDVKPEQVRSVIFDFSPKFYVCKAARYYFEVNSNLFISEKNVPSSVLDKNISNVVEFAQQASFFDEWAEVLNAYGLEITKINSEWLEIFDFIELSRVTSDEKLTTYCSFNLAEHVPANAKGKALLIPKKLSKLEFEVSYKSH